MLKTYLFVAIVTVLFALYVIKVLIPFWNEKSLKKDEEKRYFKRFPVNDSGVHSDWGEGAEAADELNDFRKN